LRFANFGVAISATLPAIPYSTAYVPKFMSKKSKQHRYFAFNSQNPEWDLLYSEVEEVLEKTREAVRENAEEITMAFGNDGGVDW
jgi:hypothetical protein